MNFLNMRDLGSTHRKILPSLVFGMVTETKYPCKKCGCSDFQPSYFNTAICRTPGCNHSWEDHS